MSYSRIFSQPNTSCFADGSSILDSANTFATRMAADAYAHSAFGVPMIRVAKSRFATATHAVPVVRDTSGATGPLYVTAAGPPAAARGVLDRRAGFQHHQLHDRRYDRTAAELAFRYGSSGRQTVQISSIALLPTAASKASKDARSSLRNLP